MSPSAGIPHLVVQTEYGAKYLERGSMGQCGYGNSMGSVLFTVCGISTWMEKFLIMI